MSENMKQSSQSFLQKFKGKANKISKQGLNQLLKQRLQPIQKQVQYKSLQPSKSPNLQQKYMNSPLRKQSDKQSQAKRLAADMDELFSSNPQYSKNRKVILKKINPQNVSSINAQQYQSSNLQKKQRLLPPLYTPQKNYKRTISSNHQSLIQSRQKQKSQSQLQSAISQKRSKYVFGKYLKLDDDAMKHFQFLKNIQKRSLIKQKNKEIISR